MISNRLHHACVDEGTGRDARTETRVSTETTATADADWEGMVRGDVFGSRMKNFQRGDEGPTPDHARRKSLRPSEMHDIRVTEVGLPNRQR